MKHNDSVFALNYRIFRVLTQSERKRLLLLLTLTFANTFIDLLGLAAVIPVIRLVIHPDLLHSNDLLFCAFQYANKLGIATPQGFLIALCVFMVFAFTFKTFFGLIVNLIQNRFAFAVALRLAEKSWSHHFSQSLELMRSSSSGRILSEINVWPSTFAHIFLIGNLLILSEILIMSFISVGLLMYNPLVFISISSLLIFGAVCIRAFTRHRLRRYSLIRSSIEPSTNSLINNAIRGFLELVTFQATHAVRDVYIKDLRTIFRLSSNAAVLNFTPSRLYESLAVAAVATSIIISLLQGIPEVSFLELLSIMAISAYRVMPSMGRLNSAMMSMRGNMHVLESIEKCKDLKTLPEGSGTISDAKATRVDIRIENLTVKYATLDAPTLSGVNLAFDHGKIHCIIGQSGSGKSTLLSAILGLHKSETGSIRLKMFNETWTERELGKDIQLNSWIRNVGYISQHPFLFQGSVRDNLTLRIPDAHLNEDLVLDLLDRFGLTHCLGDSPLEFILREGGTNLSGGQQQRLALVRALQVERAVLILDEATSALDINLRDCVFSVLRERARNGCNVLLVTHDMRLAQQCDTVFDLDKLN